MRVLTEAEIRRLVRLDEAALSAVEEGFRQLSVGEVTTPPILRLDVPEHEGELDVKTAYVRGWDAFAVKMSSGYFGNSAKGLPTSSGLMVLFAAATGFPQALLLDGGYLTTVRTAAAGAIAAKYLAPADVETLGLVGAGEQARYQALAISMVRPARRILVGSRRREQSERLAQQLREELGVTAQAASSLEELVRESELVVTATPSTVPLLREEWLHPGLHITAMGSDAPHKQELEVGILRAADVLVCDVRSQCLTLGESHHGAEAGAIRGEDLVELGEVVAGRRPGRTTGAEITVCDLTGTGVQDTAIARFAYQAAERAGAGSELA